jgi:hypothetical protein
MARGTSVWDLVLSVVAGVTNLNVWELTKDPGTPSVAIFGI